MRVGYGAPVGGREPSAVRYITFNQDCSRIAVGTTSGFRVYSTNPFQKQFEYHIGGIWALQVLLKTKVAAAVCNGDGGSTSNRVVHMCNIGDRRVVREVSLESSVLRVELNNTCMAVCLSTHILVFLLSGDVPQVARVEVERDSGLCSMSYKDSDSQTLLAYVSPRQLGEVALYNATRRAPHRVVPAHQSRVSALQLSADGSLLATASERGTLVRVFSTSDASKLYEFRRGMHAASVYNLSFQPGNLLLAVSSSSGTVHIFRLTESNRNSAAADEPSSLWSWMRVAPVTIEAVRSFATVHLRSPLPTLVGLDNMPNADGAPSDFLYALTETGIFYRYRIPADGGECPLELEEFTQSPEAVYLNDD